MAFDSLYALKIVLPTQSLRKHITITPHIQSQLRFFELFDPKMTSNTPITIHHLVESDLYYPYIPVSSL